MQHKLVLFSLGKHCSLTGPGFILVETLKKTKECHHALLSVCSSMFLMHFLLFQVLSDTVSSC